MKIIDGMKIVRIGGRITAVCTGDAYNVYKGFINLNETAYKIWQYIEDGLSLDEIASRLSTEYDDLTIDDANKYVKEFADKLIKKGILIED